MKHILLFCLLVFIVSCSQNETTEKQKEKEPPAFCDCVNKDYHKKGDKEACDKIEKELKIKLQQASVEEKGEILMKIQECKVAGQYDND